MNEKIDYRIVLVFAFVFVCLFVCDRFGFASGGFGWVRCGVVY